MSPEKAMTPHSSTLAWKIPWAEEPGRLQSMGSRRVGHDWETSLSLRTLEWIVISFSRGSSQPRARTHVSCIVDRLCTAWATREVCWRGKWQPTPVFLPGESQDRGTWWAAVYGVAQSWTQLKRLSSSSSSMSYMKVVKRANFKFLLQGKNSSISLISYLH